MTCEQALDAISAALDGELSAEERKELDEHLNTCPACAALMEELSGQSLLLRQLDCDVPAGLDARILSALPEQPRPAKKGKVILWRRWGTLAACLALALWGGFTLNNMRMGSTSADMANGSMAAQPADALPGDADDGGLAQYSGGSAEDSEPKSGSPDESAAAENQLTLGPDNSINFSMSANRGTNAEYLRVQWRDGMTSPAAVLVSSPDELTALAGSLGAGDNEVLSAYTDEFFGEHQLIAVTLTESSGSVSHTVSGLEPTEDGWQVDILRLAPDVGTCDMAAWLILVETDLSVTETDALTVSVTNG